MSLYTLVMNLSPLPPSLSEGRGEKLERGLKPPLLKSLPPLITKERGIKGVRLIKKRKIFSLSLGKSLNR